MIGFDAVFFFSGAAPPAAVRGKKHFEFLEKSGQPIAFAGTGANGAAELAIIGII